MKRGILFLMLGLFFLTSCQPRLGSAERKLAAPAFEAAISSECEIILANFRSSQVELLKGNGLTNYPTIAELNPQFVRVVVMDGQTVCDIQTSGGFNHSGIFYVAKGSDSTKIKRGDWQIKKIADRFYKYRE
jgi:hypothetical protein